MNEQTPQVMVVQSTKSVGLGIVLALLFGPIGLFYGSVVGGIVMCLIGIPFVIITLGFGAILVVPICAIWAAIAINADNKKLMNQAGSQISR